MYYESAVGAARPERGSVPLHDFVSVKKTLDAALGGKDVLGFEFWNLDEDLKRVRASGLARASLESAIEVLELTNIEVAGLVGVEPKELYYRRRPPKAGKPEKPVLLPGEETKRFMNVLLLHAIDAKRRMLEGLSAHGCANDFIRAAHLDLGAPALELVKTDEGMEKVFDWLTRRRVERYPPGSIEDVGGRWYPVAPLPWQRKKKSRIEAAVQNANGAPRGQVQNAERAS